MGTPERAPKRHFTTRDEERIKFYNYKNFKEEVREPYNWGIVWLGAKCENISRKAILKYRIYEFTEVIVHALDRE